MNAADMLLFRKPPRPPRTPQNRAVVIRHGGADAPLEFTWSLSGDTVHAMDNAVLAFGVPSLDHSPDTACVLIRASREEGSSVPDVVLYWVGFDTCCCVGGGMSRGERGTVPMLQGALVLASGLPPFRGLASVSLMDVSHRAPDAAHAHAHARAHVGHSLSLLCCSDVHILRDVHHRSWYERHVGARVCAEKAHALAALRGALAERIECSEARFARACRLAALGLGPAWYTAVAPALQSMFASAVRDRASWGELLRQLVRALWPLAGNDLGDDPVSPNVLVMLAAALGNSVVCPRWVSTNGWCWSIPTEAILGFPVHVRSTPYGAARRGSLCEGRHPFETHRLV